MLKKPLVLTLLLLLISFVIEIILDILRLPNHAGLSILGIIFSAQYVGEIYASKYKEELPQMDKIKISLYYFLTQMFLLTVIFYLLRTIKFLGAVLAPSIIICVIVSLCIFPALGRGCRAKLKRLEKDSLLKVQMMANPEYANSAIVDAITSRETELPNVRYCQYCGAEFSANENICPVCEKLNN